MALVAFVVGISDMACTRRFLANVMPNSESLPLISFTRVGVAGWSRWSPGGGVVGCLRNARTVAYLEIVAVYCLEGFELVRAPRAPRRGVVARRVVPEQRAAARRSDSER